MRRWIKTVGVLFGGLGLATGAVAQEGAYTELYGYGVHRFYAGDLAEAQRVLTEVVDSGTQDPRPHYFRGLTQHQLGMLDAAKTDFENAARLEAAGHRAVNVSFALQRVQGPVRQDIELMRLNARVAQRVQDLANRRNQMPAAPRPGLVAPSEAGSLPPSFAPEDAVPPTVPPTTAPPATTPDLSTPPADTANPFGDDPVQPATPAAPAVDPFGGAAPAAEPAPVEPAAPATPATPAPAADDPFGTPAAPAAVEPPAPGIPAAPAADDPFGAPASPAPAAPAADAPAVPASADPFGTN